MTKHGMKGTAEYRAWRGMKNRCYNPNSEDYPAYGAAGIEVCDEWRNDFATFFRDMGVRPSTEHSIDRKEGRLGYSKANCRWATKEQQSQNRPEFVIPLEFGGVIKTIAEWARDLNIHPQTIYNRHKAGWIVERILQQRPSNEIRSDNNILTFAGESLTVAQWTRRLGMKRNCLKQRLRNGWSVDRALSEPVRSVA